MYTALLCNRDVISCVVFVPPNRQHTLMFVTIPATLSLQSSSKVKAIVANIPAITSEGIYPGVNNGTFMNILVLHSALLVQKSKYMIK